MAYYNIVNTLSIEEETRDIHQNCLKQLIYHIASELST